MRDIAIDRRSLLALLGATAMTGCATAAPATTPFFKRTGLPIGLQLYTLGPDAQKDLDGTLKAVAAIGYRDIELAGLYGRTPQQMRASLDAAGLKCSSAHIQAKGGGADPNFGDIAQLSDALRVLGAKTAILPSPNIPDRFAARGASEDAGTYLRRVLGSMTADDWKANADFLNDKAAKLKSAGIKVGYHNHNVEFAPLGGTNGIEVMLKNTDPATVTFEMDVGWVAAAGHDPLEMLSHHKGRFTMMHVKDIKASTKPNFNLMQDPTEIGSGMLDWKKLLPAAYAEGVTRFFVEQEPPFERPRIDAVKIDHDYLAGLVA